MWEEEYPELDPAFVERDHRRKEGLPVLIARTARLVIRETVMEDVPRIFEIYNSPGIREIVRPSRTLEEETEFMWAYISHAYAFYDFGLWSILKKESGEVIGQAGLFPSDRLENAVELGYVIDPAFQGQGYARECGRAVLDYAFHTLDLEEIHLFAGQDNEASVRTARALGFQPEETCPAEGMLHMSVKAGQENSLKLCYVNDNIKRSDRKDTGENI